MITEKRIVQNIINYSYYIFDEYNEILKISNHTHLKDILYYECDYYTIIKDDEDFEKFKELIKNIDIEKINNLIEFLLKW